MTSKVFCLMGPTASGKTDLAGALIQQFPFEIISVDSALIYRDMTIGTAKPTSKELALTPHHLIDILDPTQSYSAAQFCKDATQLSQDILSRGRIPLLVGGTMMYFNALYKGLAPLPDADKEIRCILEQDAKKHGWEEMHRRLAGIDPVSAARIHANDAQRIERALEVYYLTNTPLSTLTQQNSTNPAFEFVHFALFPQDRKWLHHRIEQRFMQMIDMGFVDEVRFLRDKWGVTAEMSSMRCVGYRQVLDYLNNAGEFDIMVQKAIAATRQLAKRQLTWLRHWDNALYFDPEDASFIQKVMAKIQEILDNNAF